MSEEQQCARCGAPEACYRCVRCGRDFCHAPECLHDTILDHHGNLTATGICLECKDKPALPSAADLLRRLREQHDSIRAKERKYHRAGSFNSRWIEWSAHRQLFEHRFPEIKEQGAERSSAQAAPGGDADDTS